MANTKATDLVTFRKLLAAKGPEALRTLQAQINPHFLYNTLDTIIWMAEAQKTDQVVEIVSALSNFSASV